MMSWPGQACRRETLAMFGYDATSTLRSVSVPTLVCTGHLNRSAHCARDGGVHRRTDAARSASALTARRAHEHVRAALLARFGVRVAGFAEAILDDRTVATDRVHARVVTGRQT